MCVLIVKCCGEYVYKHAPNENCFQISPWLHYQVLLLSISATTSADSDTEELNTVL